MAEKLEKVFSRRLKDLGKLYAFLQSILAFLNPALIKYSGEKNTFNVMLIRGLIIIYFSYFAFKSKSKPIASLGRKIIYKLILRGILGSFGFFLFYWSLNIVSMQISLTLFHTNPLFTYLLAVIFLEEALTIRKFLCVFGMVFGLLLIINPNFLFLELKQNPNTEHPLYFTAILALIFSAFLKAIVNILLKSMKENDPSINNFFLGSASMLMCGLFYMTSETSFDFDLRKSIFFIISGILAIGILSTFLMALKYEDASTVSLISSLTIFYSFLSDIFIFNSHPEPGSIVGSLFIAFFMLILVMDHK